MRVKDLLRSLLMIVLAVFVNWQLSRFSLFLFQTINLTSLVVIYYAQRKGEIFGASLGALGGLLQDSISTGIFGSFGIPKTIVGFVAGYIARRIDVRSYPVTFIFYAGALVLEVILWSGLQIFVLSSPLPGRTIIYQPLLSSLVAVVIVWAIKRWDTQWKRRLRIFKSKVDNF